MKKRLKTIVNKTVLYNVYYDIAERRKVQQIRRTFWEWNDEDQKRFDFYRQFIRTDDIVFDVGSNLGNRAKVFSKLGATVVAIEPQKRCSELLSSVFKDRPNFYLERCALGASVGQAEMLISNAHTITSLSREWVRSVKDSGRFAEYEWDRKETVFVDTLDNLIAKYGRPAFVKIDVEGFEDQVVSGLSTPVTAVSMEFTPEFMESTMNCIEHLCRIADWRFQISLGESMEFALQEWATREQIKRKLSEVSRAAFGDLYARLST